MPIFMRPEGKPISPVRGGQGMIVEQACLLEMVSEGRGKELTGCSQCGCRRVSGTADRFTLDGRCMFGYDEPPKVPSDIEIVRK